MLPSTELAIQVIFKEQQIRASHIGNVPLVVREREGRIPFSVVILFFFRAGGMRRMIAAGAYPLSVPASGSSGRRSQYITLRAPSAAHPPFRKNVHIAKLIETPLARPAPPAAQGARSPASSGPDHYRTAPRRRGSCARQPRTDDRRVRGRSRPRRRVA